MSERLIKPYEISVWEDKLTDGVFEETKLAVIGSDTMTGLNKVYDPVFNKKSNGEKTLTFSLRYKYFDPYTGNSDFINPFAALLINERKVKLHYDDKWYEFIIKDHTESSDGLEWTYTCTDAFVLELSKNGYNITFDSELNNNQGTARELAEKTLENTDWQVGGADIGKQLIAEPVYKATLVSKTGIEIIDIDNNTPADIQVGASIYLFYNYIKNQSGKFVQFIARDNDYVIDDNNVIIDTNYRIKTELVYKEQTVNGSLVRGFYLDNNKIISIGEIENLYQAYRLAYGQLTTYDPVMGRTVDRYKIDDGDLEVYKYTDYTYTTSNVVTNFITNGENFNSLEDGTLQGWNPYVDFTGRSEENKKPDPLELVTKPELGTNKELADLTTLSQIEGFLKVSFKDVLVENEETHYYENAIYNSGIENNASTIGSIAKGDKFVFRWRAGVGSLGKKYKLTEDKKTVEGKTYYTRSGAGTDEDPYVYTAIPSPQVPDRQNHYEKYDLRPTENLGLIVATYTQEAPGWGYYYKHFTDNDIIFKTTGVIRDSVSLNNYIKGGTLEETEEGSGIYNYIIDNVIQTPSTKYIYVVSITENNTTIEKNYVWNGLTGNFEILDDEGWTNYLKYNYAFAEAGRSISNSVLQDPKTKIGIFIYHTNTAQRERIYYIQDIQLTRYIPDTDGKPITLGNVPTATSTATDYYYIKPSDGMAAEDIITYTSLEELEEVEDVSNIKPLYNENSEKNLSISASQSNCFNILQTIAETFECWVDLVVEHDERGYITYTDGKPNKYVYLKEYAGNDNYAGFKYGINLQSIERTVNSDEIVTKLIVDQSQSEYTDEGFVSIANASSNTSGESYILNFDYYYNQGLLDRETIEEDKNKFIVATASLNKQLRETEKQRRDLENSLTVLESKLNVFTELVETAEDNLSRALGEFEELTGETYESYREKHNNQEIQTDDQLTEEDTIFDLLGEIYTNSATINNYSGLLTNIEQEYWQIRNQLHGSENYKIKIWVGRDDLKQRHVFVELDDYLPDFSFTLGGSTYTSTVSKKFFDITTNATTITFSAPQDYQVESSYEINDSVVKSFRIRSDESVDGIEDIIEDLQEQKDQKTKEFNNKYSRYIQEGTWNSTDYIDSERYYLDALQVSNTSAQPTVSYTINVVEISELEGFELYTFDAGDKTYVEDTEFFGWANINGHLTPAREEVIVSEVEWHLDKPDENVITVQNYKTRFEDLFQRISAAVQTVQYNEATYAKISSLLDANGTINQDVLLESLNRISGEKYNLTSDGSVTINGDQILVQNLTNKANRVIINSEGIRISSDGGTTWRTVIDGQGINIGTVYTGTLNTNNVVIGSSDNPSFRWDKSGISAYKTKEDDTYDLKTYVRYDQYGLYGIKNNGTFKAETLQDVLDNAHFAVTWDGFFIKNSYAGGGRVEITSDNDFRVLNDPTAQGNFQEKIKIGALEWGDGITSPTAQGATALPTLYGIRIKNDAGAEVMKTDDYGNITISGTINANAGNIGGMVVNNDKLQMDTIVLEPGVGIYSTVTTNGNNMFSISDTDGSAIFRYIEALGGKLGNLSVIDTLTVGDGTDEGLIKSYNYISDFSGWKIDSAGYAEFSNAKVRGHIEAETGDFTGWVAVGDRTQNALTNPWIIISGGVTDAARQAHGSKAIIKTSNYSDGASYGWMINSDGDAVFNNITARGAIKTAVFEYAEIQAVGGIFVFRPSSTIRAASISGNDLVLIVEKPMLFAKTSTQEYSWCKISNYTTDGSEPNINNILTTNGLTHVYQISNVDLNTAAVTLIGAKAFITAVKQAGQTDNDVLTGLIGGALIDMGRRDGTSNYGIGVNSSDNTVNLPARAISLFETVINENQSIKVSYNYRGILGTLPALNSDKVSSYYSTYMAGTQGIYTDNMYIGDKNQYIAFYTDTSNPSDPKKILRISAKTLIYDINRQGEDITWDDHINEQITEQIPIRVEIESNVGNELIMSNEQARLTCTVYQGNTDITNKVTKFTWTKLTKDGVPDVTWNQAHESYNDSYIDINANEVNIKAIFNCHVTIPEN